MKGIISTAIIKGGTGKTSTTSALAQAAKKKKLRVLAVDLDPQGNLTAFLDGDETKGGCYDLLHGADVADVIQQTPQGIDLISGSDDLTTEEAQKTTRAKRLEAALAPIVKNYDYIFIDTPPNMGELTFNAIQASDALLIPLDADTASLKGLHQIAEIARKMKPSLSFIGVLLTRYRGRANINQFLRDKTEEAAKNLGAVYLGEIRDGVSIREAQSMKKDLFEYAAKSNPAQDYMRLFEQIKRRK